MSKLTALTYVFLGGALIFQQLTIRALQGQATPATIRTITTALSNVGPDTELRKAFEAHEQADGDCLGKECHGIDGAFVRSERWKNFQNYAKDCPRIAAVTEVSLGKTMDGGEWVVGLTSAGNKTCSLWLKGSDIGVLTVKSFTSY